MGVFKPSTDEQYRDQALAVGPRGAAHTREPGQRYVELVHGLMGFEAERFDARIEDLFDEADPRTTTEMIDAWERNYGLPDDCDYTPPTTLAGRRRALWAKVTAHGGQTIAYLERIAEAAGGTNIVITELFGTAWRCDSSRCDEPISGEGVVHTFSVAGNHNGFDDEIKCAIDTRKPAHTHAIYSDLVP